MTTLPEIIDLFSKLALHLHSSPVNQDEVDSSLDLSISKLNQSLNLTENSKVRVLDTALSLMCFKAPQVFDSMIEYLVKTIVSVLISSINCKVLPVGKGEILQIGSSISHGDCMELIEVCRNVISELESRGMSSHSLLHAFVRVAVASPRCRYLVPSMHFVLDVKSIDGRCNEISKLVCHLQKEFSVQDHEIPLSLLLWYLDPLTLKNDITKILQDTIQRPFLSLRKEFYERMDWRSILTCLVLSPMMFSYTRALLHNWFMLTGLASILDVLIELVSVILDMISGPTCWGMSIKLGSKLPFSHAYFPCKNHILRILAGPLSSDGFLQLLYVIRKPVSLSRDQSGPSKVMAASIDHESIWALAISFPNWFYFASLLLLSDSTFQEEFKLTCTVEVLKFDQKTIEAPNAAARYIAWILSPIDESSQDRLSDSLAKISEFWTLKQMDSDTCEKGRIGHRKKLKKPKFSNEDSSFGSKHDCHVISLWLKEFQDINYANEAVCNPASYEAKPSVLVSQHNLLFRRIPLGILIGYPSHINEDVCELLLHYAATGRILHSIVTKNAGKKHLKLNSGPEDLFIGSAESIKKEAVAGACLVFSLTDIVERMSASLFENEESALNIMCLVKSRTGRYLIKCVQRLIQFNIDEDGVLMLMDLQGRLKQWRHQGQEVLQLQKGLDDAIEDLNAKLSSS